MTALKPSYDEAKISARQGSPYRRHLADQAKRERDAMRAEWSARRDARESARRERRKDLARARLQLLLGVFAEETSVVDGLSRREVLEALGKVCEELEHGLGVDLASPVADPDQGVPSPPSEVPELRLSTTLGDDSLAFSVSVNQPNSSTHEDSSTRGAVGPALRITVEVGSRGGQDSGPHADAASDAHGARPLTRRERRRAAEASVGEDAEGRGRG